MKLDKLRMDLHRNFPKGWGSIANFMTNPGVISLFIYRYLHAVSYVRPSILRLFLLFPGKVLEKIWGDFYGIHISRHAIIGGGFKISHFSTIFINEKAKIGDNVTVCQGVTIGVWGEKEKRGAPTIGNNVYIGPGAKLFGSIKIGNDVRIGANVVVYFDVPDNSTIYTPVPSFKIRPFFPEIRS